MRIGDWLLVTAEEKANVFAAQHVHVSRQVRAPKIDLTRARTTVELQPVLLRRL
ncbi:hypothetical protein FJT64_021153 [Amphibalanus amphitrite]|uniref:Uncharacterized protein n=1 Tax=Amphibalanus amphitrite TaxID=1232801 RepID=A0A6A4WQD5_AMPAM|nr:hypothetical protein FJT64_021153 [Amphibalanus amphitrite]